MNSEKGHATRAPGRVNVLKYEKEISGEVNRKEAKIRDGALFDLTQSEMKGTEIRARISLGRVQKKVRCNQGHFRPNESRKVEDGRETLPPGKRHHGC